MGKSHVINNCRGSKYPLFGDFKRFVFCSQAARRRIHSFRPLPPRLSWTFSRCVLNVQQIHPPHTNSSRHLGHLGGSRPSGASEDCGFTGAHYTQHPRDFSPTTPAIRSLYLGLIHPPHEGAAWSLFSQQRPFAARFPLTCWTMMRLNQYGLVRRRHKDVTSLYRCSD